MDEVRHGKCFLYELSFILLWAPLHFGISPQISEVPSIIGVVLALYLPFGGKIDHRTSEHSASWYPGLP